MRKRRLVKDIKEAEIKAAESLPAPAKRGKGFQKGAANPHYRDGSMSSEIELSAEAFAEMEKQEKEYKRLVTIRAREQKWDALKVMAVMGQVNRVVRLRAILKSNCARMIAEPNYRKKVQDPTTTESIFRYEATAQKQEAILNQMLGLDEMHEAKLGAAEQKSKPTDFKVIVGGNMSKAHMAVGAEELNGEDE